MKVTSSDVIDFEKILWLAIDEMRKNITYNEPMGFINSLQALELLLTPKIRESPKYQKSYNDLNIKFKKDIILARTDSEKKKVQRERNMAWARALMNLVSEAQYLPTKRDIYEED